MNIYYLPGRGGRLETGLGEALVSRALTISGRETLVPEAGHMLPKTYVGTLLDRWIFTT